MDLHLENSMVFLVQEIFTGVLLNCRPGLNLGVPLPELFNLLILYQRGIL